MPETSWPGGTVIATVNDRFEPATGVQLSIRQFDGHASPSSVLPSSHVSPGSM